MARRKDRIIALTGAVVFIISTLGLTAGVIWQMVQDSRNKKVEQQIMDQSANNPNKLVGTKLANFTPIAQATSLQVSDTTPGTGQEVKPGDDVTVDYTGAVAATGVIFESSKDSGQQASFNLNGVIKGWTDGIPGMKVGGTRRLLIPAAQAYGPNPPEGSGIPANADLVFDVTLHSVGK